MKRVIVMLLCIIAVVSPLLVATPVANAAAMDSSAGVVTTKNYSLNIRSGMSTSSAIVGAAQKGSYLTLLEKNGQWWRVEYGKGKYGYCHADYITPVSGAPASVNTKSMDLNVRSGAGTEYARIGSLSKGEIIIVLSSSGNWSKVLYHGNRTGFVSSQYLLQQSTSVGSVSLRVPNFKQTDSRWSNIYIGSSGKTMAQIGCATTAIAMMESYRTGVTIYPNDMAKRLQYTSSGSVYWPSHFQVVTGNADLLGNIKRLLDSGKPVLIGGKTYAGKQHWVVATGYTGAQMLHASDFLVNDPGSSKVTNLQQFFDNYPEFYKYFYYN